jgi:hypothetical protein
VTRFNEVVTDDEQFLSTPTRRVLFLVGTHAALSVITAIFVGAVALVTLRAGFDGLDPAGTAWRIAAAVLGWDLVTGAIWTARHWRGPAGFGTLVRTGRSEKRTRPGRRSRALRWTRDAVALVVAIVGILLLRFPDDPSAPRAAAVILGVTKGLQLGMYGSAYAMDRALTRLRDRLTGARPPRDPHLVPVEDILNRPDIAGDRG